MRTVENAKDLAIITTMTGSAVPLRTFVRKFSNIGFFLKILPLNDDEFNLVM